MGRLTGARSIAPAVVVSCEHASNRVPRRYHDLGLTAGQLGSHVAWDPGALTIARACARRLRAPLHAGRWSRLLVDLNRSAHHRDLCPRATFGIAVPGNTEIDADERAERIERFYLPHRRAVESSIEAAIAARGSCFHCSVHSFTPVAAGSRRRAGVGLLYDPSRTRERRLAHAWAERLRATGLHVRFNYPYRGTADGFTTHLRRLHPDARYAGIELEVNQALLAGTVSCARIARIVSSSLAAALDAR